MKKIMFLIVVLGSVYTYADCPLGFYTTRSCQSTPQNGDNKIVSQMVEKIDVCVKGRVVKLALVAQGENAIAVPQVTPIADGVQYVLPMFSFYLGSNNSTGRLVVKLGGKDVSSTFTCHRTR